jgi:hypothetical protein
LFGIFAEGVIVTNAVNVTAAVADEEQDVPLPIWAIVLIAVASASCCLCMIGLLRKRTKGE